MDRMQIEKLAGEFYQAIIDARPGFLRRDLMSNFPRGCDDASDLFAYYLFHNFSINSVQCNGRYEDENLENTTNHVWLLVDGIIVDLTYSQFNIGSTIYIGNENSFYQGLENKVFQENYNIENNAR